MSTFTLRKFSESVDGEPILVVATASPGTLIHTATAGTAAADDFDKIWMWLQNNHTGVVDVTIQFGGTAAKNDIKKQLQPKTGVEAMIPANILQNSKEVRVYASVASVVTALGEVHRATP